MKTYALSLLALFAVLGCSGSSGTSATTTGNTIVDDKRNAGAPAPKLADLPAAVKHEAFDYFGLGSEKTMNVEMRVKGRPPKTGAITAKLQKIDGDTATYAVERTGGIESDLGTDTVVVDKTGIYMTGTSIGTMTPAKSLQLPANLAPGTKWDTSSSVTKTGMELSEKDTYIVKGTEKLTTKAGTYDALVVTSTGTGTVKYQGTTSPATFTAVSYYVKGRGLVKQIVNMTLKGQPSNTVTIEETS